MYWYGSERPFKLNLFLDVSGDRVFVMASGFNLDDNDYCLDCVSCFSEIAFHFRAYIE